MRRAAAAALQLKPDPLGAMTQLAAASNPLVHRKPLLTRVGQGAGLVVFMTLFRALGGMAGGMSTGKFFVVLGAAAIGGGAGGAAYYATDPWRARGGARKTFANVVSILAYAAVAVLALVLAFGTG